MSPLLAGLERLVRAVCFVPEPPPALVRGLLSLPLVEKDAPVLAAATASGGDLMVTGDSRHFGHLSGQGVGGVAVVWPAEAFDLLVAPWPA